MKLCRVSLFVIVMVALVILAPSHQVEADSLFSKRVANSGTLISDKRVRFEEGDVITVLIRETIDATTTSLTDTEKESDVTASANPASNRFLVGQGAGDSNFLSPGLLPNWQIEIENEHEAEGTTRRTNQLTMTIGCTVARVYENGNMQIEGTKRITVNREDTLLVVSGLVRARDVSAANTVDSNQMANTFIQLQGRGPLWNNQRRGFFTKILDWFSPF